jgi:hypothetical protein
MEPEVSLPVHNSPSVVPILSHMHPAHTLTLNFFNNYFNIIFYPSLFAPSDLFHSDLPTLFLYAFLTFSSRSTCPAQPTVIDMFTPTMFYEEFKLRSPSLSSVRHHLY